MKGLELILTLREDCVFSDRAATVGGHKGLNYIPGATLLGAAAAKLYSQLSKADAFRLFHSGQVRFGNGLPLALTGEPTWPLPMCWHQVKGQTIEQQGQLLAESIWYGAKLPDSTQQPQQIRQGYVTESGRLVQPIQTMQMKTAIDPETGRARESALFGYQAIAARQRFTARITADDNISKDLWKKLRQVFTEPVLLGRSRSAEYGLAHSTLRELTAASLMPDKASFSQSKQILLWLLSDLAALDEYGQPTLAPRPEWLSLPSGKLNTEQTFIRTRRYSPWNAYRGGPDIERQILSQGSILVFDIDQPLTAADQSRIAAGLGTHREAGLGQVWLNPAWLNTDSGHPQFTPAAQPAVVVTPKKPTSDLIRWLEGEQTAQQTRGELTKQAQVLAREYAKLLISARKLKGLDSTVKIGPSVSQWGSVLQAAKGANTNQALEQALFNGDNCVCKSSMPGWPDEYWDDSTAQKLRTFKDWIHITVCVHSTPQTPRLVRMLAREIIDVVKQNRQPSAF